MNESSGMARYAPLAGVVFVVLLVVSALLIAAYDYLPDAARAVEILENPSLFVGAYLGALSGFFLMWFAGSLRASLRQRESSGRLSELAFGGGLGGGLLVVVAFAILIAGADRATSGGGISDAQALMVYDTYGGMMGFPLPMAMAVMVAATAGVSLRMGVFPKWFGWVSVVLAIALLSPISYIAIVVALVWVLVVGVWLFRQGSIGGTTMG